MARISSQAVAEAFGWEVGLGRHCLEYWTLVLDFAQVIGSSWAGLGFAGYPTEDRKPTIGFGSLDDWLEAKHGGNPVLVYTQTYSWYILALADMTVVAAGLMDRRSFEGSRSGESVDWADTDSRCWVARSAVVVGR